MPTTPDPSFGASSQRVKARSLSLSQLQKLAAQGSRRARAELDNRMRATDAAGRGVSAPAAESAVPAFVVSVPAIPAAPAAGAPGPSLVERLELIARQDEQRARAADPPRLVGMMLIAWGVLTLLGALVMLARGGGSHGGLYYLFCALGAAAVGWLLMQCSRWAMALHGALLLAALGWAWHGARGNWLTLLLQAAPLLIPAFWMAAPQVREPLE